MRTFFSSIRGNAVYASILLLSIIITLTVFFAFRNQRVMKDTNARIAEADVILRNTKELWNGINLMDLGVRGYALTHKDGLKNPFIQAVKVNRSYIDSIRTFMQRQNLPTEKLEKYVVLNNDYIALCREMIGLVDRDSMSRFTSLLEEDRGLALWLAYSGFSTDLSAHENQIKAVAKTRYQSAVNGNTWIALLLILVGAPSLYIVFYRIRKQAHATRGLLLDLESNNRKYVFDPGGKVEEDHLKIMNISIENLKQAAAFIKKVTNGEFDAAWPGMTTDNAKLNKESLSGTLINMRDQMRRIKEDDENRIWVTEGLAKFTEIIRNHQDDAATLSEQSIRFIAKYMNAQQAAVFLLQEEDDAQFLQLVACYAFDKKKFVEKRVGLGQGIVGQSFLERVPTMLKAVPNGYTHITSGLGEATPSCLLIVPMQYNEQAEGVVEIAGFSEWPEHQRSFLFKATEYMAAALSSVRSTQKMKTLLGQMQEQTETLHAQEEEMRQNMEELAATNEEMKRKESEYLRNGAVAAVN
ncbi:MAG TPA: GAF domain-containing protein [Chryseolinea sp.]|nr:GAF domain-containing protein [Chryseolinea sp.]